MASRYTLHEELERILGNTNVYFQPPETVKLNYPCILYYFNGLSDIKADDSSYLSTKQYALTLVHRDPDNTIWEEIKKLPMCRFDKSYNTNNLYHYTFTIFH